MKNRSTIVTLFFVILCAALVSTHHRVAYAQEKDYYLTIALVQGNGVPGACVSGYHVASIVELSDLSKLHYLTTYAGAYQMAAADDQGDGPPAFVGGWVRSNGNVAGLGNCDVWSTNSSSISGTLGEVEGSYNSTTGQVQVYLSYQSLACNKTAHVWCIQNP